LQAVPATAAARHRIDYDLSIISERAFAPGIERSWFFWAPSIAPSGLAVYRGKAFADWDGKLLVGGLVSRSVSRMRPAKQAGFFIEEERMFGSRDKRIALQIGRQLRLPAHR
jgi:glucose/arabinose dehydrogenase